ncbi:hypothetical protein F5X96DRAFT_677238 [Biscogniauxia mediterranea]|nr:hypothetical protein F5X96DRAFT_677238 [Biscogniauxia mediterranea]
MSNSSDVSSPLSSPDSRADDQMSPAARGSPILFADNPQLGTPPRCWEAAHWRVTGGTHSPSRTTGAGDTSLSAPPRSTLIRSKPIAIELPTAKKANSAPVYTPPAPLSARGDLPGGYFPLHEDQTRVYRPHPFQLDASKARLKSIQRASGSSPDSLTAVSNVTAIGVIPATSTSTAPSVMADRSALPQLATASLPRSSSSSRSTTPVASYMPTGTQDNTMPMGKYYPSNYEKRKDDKRRAHGARPLASDSASSNISKSDSQVPTFKESPTMNHSRNESEAKRRLQQYQRDMIAQATLALNGGNVNAAALSSLRTMGFSNMSKPSKPRLAPLGSPGPVTPMELEGSEDGYIGARGPVNAQAEEIARAIRAEEERKRREGTTSPAIELGPSTF